MLAERTDRPPSWQISLREILMLVVIVGLLLTVWRLADLGPLENSPFYATFNLGSMVQEVGAEAGRPLRYTSKDGSSRTEQYTFREFDYVFYSSNEPAGRSQLVAALHSRISKLITESGCALGGGSLSGNRQGEPESFTYSYRHRGTAGLVYAYSQETTRDAFRVVVLVVESKAD